MKKREDIDCDQAIAKDPNDVYALAYTLFEIEKQRLGIVDFDDMIFLAWRLLRDKRVVLLAEQARCEYLLVDEFHDTDRVQMGIAKALSEPQKNIWCVADPNQSIYGWRGADYRFCMNFGEHFPEHAEFHLATNYRSLPHIVSLYRETILGCGSVIEGFLEKINPFRKHKEPAEGMPEFIEFATDSQEAVWVAKSIAEWRAKDERDIAILYRTNRQACLLESELFRADIPYIVQGASSFFSRAEVKDLLAFLRILDNRDDNSALERIVKSQAECSKYLGAAFLRELAKGGDHWFENLCTVRLPKRYQMDRARELHDFIEQLDLWTKKLPVDEQLHTIAEESGLMDSLQDNEQYEETADNDASENVPQVIRVAGTFKSRQEFLTYVSRVSAASERKYDKKESPVRLMTVHRSKGLEFSIVYFVGVNNDIVPHKKSQHSKEAIDEEQRVAYVAISRAMNHLYVSCWDTPSRFLRAQFAAGQKVGCVTVEK
jgi:DNA helicase-2/ATP-dependent DNA helicase PcrA